MAEKKIKPSKQPDKKTKSTESADKTIDQAIDLDGPLQRELLFQWTSYERPYRPLNKQVFSTLIAFVILLSIVLYFVGGGISAVILLISVMFLFYVLGTIKPADTVHTLDTWGIETNNRLYVWEQMTHYWFEDYGESRVLVIGLTTRWPRFLRIVIDTSETEELLNEVLSLLLVQYQPEPNWVDKGTNWIEEHIHWDISEDSENPKN